MRKLVRDLRRTRVALGDRCEMPAAVGARSSRQDGQEAGRRSRARPAGHVIGDGDVAIKSPGDGLPPYLLDQVHRTHSHQTAQAGRPDHLRRALRRARPRWPGSLDGRVAVVTGAFGSTRPGLVPGLAGRRSQGRRARPPERAAPRLPTPARGRRAPGRLFRPTSSTGPRSRRRGLRGAIGAPRGAGQQRRHRSAAGPSADLPGQGNSRRDRSSVSSMSTVRRISGRAGVRGGDGASAGAGRSSISARCTPRSRPTPDSTITSPLIHRSSSLQPMAPPRRHWST